MSLPSIPRTHKTLNTPYFDKPIKYQAFDVGLQSILLQVSDKDTPLSDRVDALTQVIDSCILNDDLDCSKLPHYVVELLFVKMRCISIGEDLNIIYTCKHKDENGKECGKQLNVTYDLDQFTIAGEVPDPVIDAGAGFKLHLRAPSMGEIAGLANSKDKDPDGAVVAFVDYVTNGDDVWEISKYPEAERIAWAKTLGMDVKLKVIKFLSNMPHIELKHKEVCGSCGHEHDITITSLQEVFI